MKTAGVICECNPFHGGHRYLLKKMRESGAETVVALMSGCFVQRGEAAVLDPYARAEVLLHCGADAVLELPFPYAASGTEFFATAGVRILSALGTDELWFGSECGDLARLQRLSEIAASDAFSERYRKEKGGSRGTAEAFFSTLVELSGDGVACEPNDILALAYMSAIRSCDSRMRPVTVRRVGSAYREEQTEPGVFPSAMALRRRWENEGAEAILSLLPPKEQEILRRETEEGRAPARMENAERLILGFLRLTSPQILEAFAELSGGLSGRLCRAAESADSLPALLAAAATKKYPNARLQRGILMALTGVTRQDQRAFPAYVRLLGANRQGQRLLREIRKTSAIPVATRRAEVPKTDAAHRQYFLETQAKALYSLCLPVAGTAGALLRRKPILIDATDET